MLKNMREYGTALWADMAARMSGTFAIVFGLWQVYSNAFNGTKGAIHAQWYWWFVAAFCFIFANYRVWVDEHKKVVSQTPLLMICPEHVDWWFQEKDVETVIIVAVTIKNVGAASLADKWAANLVVGGISQSLKAIRVRDWILPDPSGKAPLHIKPQDQIALKTCEGRIATGEGRNGRAFFSIPGDMRNLLSSLNWNLEISCEDFRRVRFAGYFRPHPGAVLERKAFPNEQILSSSDIKSLLLEEGHDA